MAPMAPRPEDVQATFAATLVDEWILGGVAHAVVAPGSRSAPLALALAERPELQVHVHHDERAAGFLALGFGLALGRPAVVLTTSGTAAVELHPALVEADLAGVPLLACTADRPPELQDVGAPQAIDQLHLFGRAARWFHAPGVADAGARGSWRSLARRSLAAATGAAPGPVHLNLAFREPLLGVAGPLPEELGRGPAAPAPPVPEALPAETLPLLEQLVGRRGVVVAGPGSGGGAAVDGLARALGWPVLAAPQAEVWGVEGAVIPAADTVLRSQDLATELRPEAVLRLGMPLASRVVGEWVARSGAVEVVASGPGRWTDPHGTAAAVLPCPAQAVAAGWLDALRAGSPVDDGAWRARWVELGEAAAHATDAVLAAEPAATEPGTARAVVAALPEDALLMVSSSMPIRDVEWYGRPRPGLRVHANRGANGIDGILATAIGLALGGGRPTGVLLGDLAFLYDATALVGAVRRGVDLTVVVVDNDGGGIFSFLPQAGAVAPDRFEDLFGTPHGTDLVALARGLGVPARLVEGDVEAAVAEAVACGGVQVLVVRTDRTANVAVHRRVHDAVAAAVGA
jgi:2-succinyl-5-enolpyruvyl-6-hydroxy-3-cyclohexene-1-carboxylate synthase